MPQPIDLQRSWPIYSRCHPSSLYYSACCWSPSDPVLSAVLYCRSAFKARPKGLKLLRLLELCTRVLQSVTCPIQMETERNDVNGAVHLLTRAMTNDRMMVARTFSEGNIAMLRVQTARFFVQTKNQLVLGLSSLSSSSFCYILSKWSAIELLAMRIPFSQWSASIQGGENGQIPDSPQSYSCRFPPLVQHFFFGKEV